MQAVDNVSGTTWEPLVLGCTKMPACLLCGAIITGPRKTLPFASIDDVLVKLEGNDTAGHSVLVRACRNIVRTALTVHANVCGYEDDVVFNACACCHYWFQRRAKRPLPLIPLLTLQWHLTVMHVDRGSATRNERTCDVRVLRRLCTMLVARQQGLRNYYWTLFSAAEQEVMQRISQGIVAHAVHHHALWFRAQNNCTPFMHSARVAEMVRAAIAGEEVDNK